MFLFLLESFAQGALESLFFRVCFRFFLFAFLLFFVVVVCNLCTVVAAVEVEEVEEAETKRRSERTKRNRNCRKQLINFHTAELSNSPRANNGGARTSNQN